MVLGSFTIAEWFVLMQRELLLFAAAFFALGVLDELAVDVLYLWYRLKGRARTPKIAETAAMPPPPLAGQAAVFLPAWDEASVIRSTLEHMLAVWPQPDLAVFVGCYPNDPATIEAVEAIAQDEARVRLVIHDRNGPTSKADCLNSLYAALAEEERAAGSRFRMVILHDAEDRVDPLALTVLDRAIDSAEFVQLPVLALPQRNSLLIGSHYSDEFAESHSRAMVVRDALGSAIPGAGVGCAIARGALAGLADRQGGKPFAAESLTEDYELGIKISQAGGRGRFLRLRSADGHLIATRAYFPSQFSQSVRQKARWTHGIALQGWDRLGWGTRPVDFWMQLRDRRGPLASLLLVTAYLLIILVIAALLLEEAGVVDPPPMSAFLIAILWFNLAGLALRVLVRAIFTTREHGLVQGLLSIPRAIVSNLIAIVAGARALTCYVGTLRGAPVIWDKTDHSNHPSHPQTELAR